VRLERQESFVRSPEDKQLHEAVIPLELMQALRFGEFNRTVKPHFSMQFVLNGHAYHFDGVVTALSVAHKQGKIDELNQFAALPGLIVRLCYSFNSIQREAFSPALLVQDSARWTDVSEDGKQ
jgi:hypothetical protein